jgi:hypothetical protein
MHEDPVETVQSESENVRMSLAEAVKIEPKISHNPYEQAFYF